MDYTTQVILESELDEQHRAWYNSVLRKLQEVEKEKESVKALFNRLEDENHPILDEIDELEDALIAALEHREQFWIEKSQMILQVNDGRDINTRAYKPEYLMSPID